MRKTARGGKKMFTIIRRRRFGGWLGRRTGIELDGGLLDFGA